MVIGLEWVGTCYEMAGKYYVGDVTCYEGAETCYEGAVVYSEGAGICCEGVGMCFDGVVTCYAGQLSWNRKRLEHFSCDAAVMLQVHWHDDHGLLMSCGPQCGEVLPF